MYRPRPRLRLNCSRLRRPRGRPVRVVRCPVGYLSGSEIWVRFEARSRRAQRAKVLTVLVIVRQAVHFIDKDVEVDTRVDAKRFEDHFVQLGERVKVVVLGRRARGRVRRAIWRMRSAS